MHAILGGKNPHLQSFLVGGMATPVDPDRQASLNIQTIAQFKKLIAGAQEFVSKVYIPDLLAVASFYKDWAGYGAGVGNYMVYGEYPLDDEANPERYIKPGIIRARDISKVEVSAVRVELNTAALARQTAWIKAQQAFGDLEDALQIPIPELTLPMTQSPRASMATTQDSEHD